VRGRRSFGSATSKRLARAICRARATKENNRGNCSQSENFTRVQQETSQGYLTRTCD
jgi:hypothetical protein